MFKARTIAKKSLSRETMEGAGVRLHRAFGYNEVPDFSPFLMLDDFRVERSKDYLAGFPLSIRTVELRRLLICLRGQSSTVTVWVMWAMLMQAKSSG